jgi:anthranilate phosphoribosyltransferase
MINSLKDFIQLAFDNNLNRENTSLAFNIIMSGESTDAQISAFFDCFTKKWSK